MAAMPLGIMGDEGALPVDQEFSEWHNSLGKYATRMVIWVGEGSRLDM